MSTRPSFQESKKKIIYIVCGALLPVYPFYVFISYYESLGVAFACSYYGWWSECGYFATIWLGAEAVGVFLIIKGLFLFRKNS